MNILVLCTGNSCRSQMAEGYLRYYGSMRSAQVAGNAPIDRGASSDLSVFSAGIETHGVNPKAIQIMKEDGIDISHHTSNNVNEYKNIQFDHVITVCDNARESCPVFPSTAKTHHQNFPDPAKASGTETEVLKEFRRVRDLIKNYCRKFISLLPAS